MLRNYCTTIIRNLWKNKFYTFINIVSLSVGIASIVWGFQNYRFSFGFNKFHKDTKNIFRVVTKIAGSDYRKGMCPGSLVTQSKIDFPVVQLSLIHI